MCLFFFADSRLLFLFSRIISLGRTTYDARSGILHLPFTSDWDGKIY